LQRLARYKQLTCPEEIRVERGAQEASVEFYYVEAAEPQPNLLVDMLLSWILSVGRHGTDCCITPLRVDLARPVKYRTLLENHFGCRVRFKADRNEGPGEDSDEGFCRGKAFGFRPSPLRG
jgi:hypothetical protein